MKVGDNTKIRMINKVYDAEIVSIYQKFVRVKIFMEGGSYNQSVNLPAYSYDGLFYDGEELTSDDMIWWNNGELEKIGRATVQAENINVKKGKNDAA